jgi:hypothetical protein
MMGIDRLASVPPSGGPAQSAGADARTEARGAIGEIGHRVLAWVSASAGRSAAGSGAAAWAGATGSASSFQPSAAELSRGGDVYDLGGLSHEIAGRMGATPTQEGELHRALGDFARASVVQIAGLSGAAGDRQIAGVAQALDASQSAEAGEGVDGVIGRVQAATASLVAQNGG